MITQNHDEIPGDLPCDCTACTIARSNKNTPIEVRFNEILEDYKMTFIKSHAIGNKGHLALASEIQKLQDSMAIILKLSK